MSPANIRQLMASPVLPMHSAASLLPFRLSSGTMPNKSSNQHLATGIF
uniref:Uncharacterized protein n=1 Tax=Rhizophora mucronata TaxID=61149 RepID=A0A2P2LFY4_RHIMU